MQEIWIINQYAITPDLPGGTRHYDLGCELVKTGDRVRIFASDVNLALRTHTKLHAGRLFEEEAVSGVEFTWVRSAMYRNNDWRRVWNMISFAINVLRVGMRLKGRPRAVIGSSPHPLAAFSAWALAKCKRARFILELRDLWPQALVDMGGLSEGSLTVRGMRLLEKLLNRSAHTIIVLAPGSRDYLLRKGVGEDRIEYIPNGVHLGNFQAEGASGCCQEVSAAGWEERCFTVLYAGAHGPANALDTILDAAQILAESPEIRFVLVGDGPAKLALVQRAQRLKLPNVRFMDPVPKEKIPTLLASADAGLITLKAVDAFAYAVSPNKIFDYMAASRPVLCAVPGEMARLVDEYGAGLVVEPENPKALALAVQYMAKLPLEERQAMGRRGRVLVEARYSREELAKRFLAICRGCANGLAEHQTGV